MSDELNKQEELNVAQPTEEVIDPTQGVEPTIVVDDTPVAEEPLPEDVKEEQETPEQEVPEPEVQEEPKPEEPKEEGKEEAPQPEEKDKPEVEEVTEPEKEEQQVEEEEKVEPEKPEEDIEAIKAELAELKAIQQEEKELQDFSVKRDNAVNEYNMMCGRLADALAEEFKRYGIDASKTIEEIEKEDSAKAEIAKGLIAQAQRIQEEQKAKVNDELNTAFTDIVFTKAARLMEKFGLTEEQENSAATTFIEIMNNSGIKDLAEDLKAKVELAVAKAKMVAPAMVKAVEETKEAVEAIKDVVEAVEAPVVEEPPKKPEPVVEPVAVEDFTEGVVQNSESTPQAALDESNVLQKLASLPYKERTAFYKEHYDLITRAAKIASVQHAQQMRDGLR